MILSTFQPISSTLALGAGCYWGTEKFIVNDFQKSYLGAIKDAKVGFMSPNKDISIKHPSYDEVCTGKTSYIEVLMIELNNPTQDLFEELCKFFFMFHDPTTLNRQGSDIGTQYASIIFCSDQKQFDIATNIKKELQYLVSSQKITTYQTTTIQTSIAGYTEFYPAHEEHQKYLEKHPLGYCNHGYRFKKWPIID